MLIKFARHIFFLFLMLLSFNFAYVKELPTDSVYNLGSKLVEYNGKIVDISDLKGKIQIFSMIYTNCKTVCPIIINNMKTLYKLIPENLLQDINFTLITLDPDRDSVESLNKFFLYREFDKQNWRLFKTTKDETLKIALAVGIKYKKEKNNEYTHSNLIIILDKNGIVKFHHQGLNKDYNSLIKLIKTLI